MPMPTEITSRVAPPSRSVQSVPLLDIQQENEPLLAEMVEAVGSVLTSGRYVLGPECETFEQEVAESVDARFGIGCASGSDALLLALMAKGIGPGDEVIVPSFTFFATASCVWRLGATPKFADIDPATFNLDPESVREVITPNTKAIIPVHLFGQCAAIEAFRDLGQADGIYVVEDAAQAIGARRHGTAAGSLGDVACFSFYPTKNLGGVGDAGMLTTNDEALATQLRLLRGHGMHPRYYHHQVGINSRLDSVQAAMLRVKFPHLRSWTSMRQANARRYDQLFGDADLDAHLARPAVDEGNVHVWNQYTVRVFDGRRDALRAYLTEAGIGTEVYYPVPLHQQTCFESLRADQIPLPVTECLATEVLSLPISPALEAHQQEYVVSTIASFLQS
ncbi:MAG: DegT/DnrJ/EryC1/StrS family aminotransferase [Planctomycetota bacterium]